MGECTFTERVKEWLAFLPTRLAFRLVWLAALTGHSGPRAVYRAMWDAQLNLPRIPSLTGGRDAA